MDQRSWIILALMTLFCLCTSGLAAQQWMARTDLKRVNSELHAQVQDLELKQTAVASQMGLLNKQMKEVREREEATRIQAALKVDDERRRRAQAERATKRSDGKPSCFDSDAELGEDSIFVRGYVQVGGGRVTDHCRLGQLVEHSCIENPTGSGRWIHDAKILTCPDKERCVSGECLH